LLFDNHPRRAEILLPSRHPALDNRGKSNASRLAKDLPDGSGVRLSLDRARADATARVRIQKLIQVDTDISPLGATPFGENVAPTMARSRLNRPTELNGQQASPLFQNVVKNPNPMK
jgi:hypothetical protein